MKSFLGVDIGSSTSKGVILNVRGGSNVYHSILSGVDYRRSAEELRRGLLEKAGGQLEICYTVATGKGAGLVSYSNEKVADLRCCARGVNSLFPSARTVIDVEGQSTQVMRISEQGRVTNFVVSEKCAAGCGRFIDIISNVLQIPIDEIGPLSLKSGSPVTFTTACAVFGESEAVSRVSEGVPKEDILAGVHSALAEKIDSLVNRVGIEQDCVICGGGALNIGLVRWLEKKLKISLIVQPYPQYVTALGAALFAKENMVNK